MSAVAALVYLVLLLGFAFAFTAAGPLGALLFGLGILVGVAGKTKIEL